MQIVVNLMLFFFAISIGQLWQQHKVLGSIVAYFVTRFVYGIIAFIVNMVTGTFGMIFSYAANPTRYFTRTTNSALILSIVMFVVMYISCVSITDKKLNLD